MQWSTLCRYDERWFEDLHAIVDVEPVRERDKAMMGMLKHLGIEKGKPYNPDAKTKGIFRRAVIDAYYYMQQRYLTVEPDELYWPDRRWRNVFYADANMGFSWDLDEHARLRQPLGPSVVHRDLLPEQGDGAAAHHVSRHGRDKDGNLFEAGKTYALTVPKDVPINKFWSLTSLRHGDLGLHLHREQRIRGQRY